MSEQPANPYSAPQSGDTVDLGPSSQRELIPLWIWLTVAVLTSVVATPADPISLWLSLVYGLLCFWVGIVLGSRMILAIRLPPFFIWCAFEIWSFVRIGNQVFDAGWEAFFLAVSVCYGLFSIAFGVWTFRSIKHGRLRILASFSLGYVLGFLFGPLPTALGAVLVTLLARRLFHQRKKTIRESG